MFKYPRTEDCVSIVLLELTIEVLCGDYAATKNPTTPCFTRNLVLHLRSRYLLNQILLWEIYRCNLEVTPSRLAAKSSIWPLKFNSGKSKHQSTQISPFRLDPASYKHNSAEKVSSWQRQMDNPSPCLVFTRLLLCPFKPVFSCWLSLLKLSIKGSKVMFFSSFLNSWWD